MKGDLSSSSPQASEETLENLVGEHKKFDKTSEYLSVRALLHINCRWLKELLALGLPTHWNIYTIFKHP